ncbi:MAG: class I SAM-dependent methyltransferase [Gemmatimonadetes bacterium]|nr:class I SAM-dependent methyltransferase [Gemmatimonadota bacterium]NNM07231.1 class I SAM-dependent methyltransferase [Gemmatimonadota bacterium]
MDPSLFDLNAKLENAHWWYRARARVIRELALTLMPPFPSVVEVGCGTGGVLAALPDDWERIGVDPAEKAIGLGRSLYPDLDLRVGLAPEAVKEDLERADLVLICDVLEHVEDDGGLFSQIVRCLKPGGHLLLTVPANPKLWTDHDVTHGHFRRYTRGSLAALLGQSPLLQVRLFSPFNRYLYPIVRVVRSVSRIRGKTLGAGDSDLFLPPRPVNRTLEAIFFAEHKGLLAALDRPHRKPRMGGVSWIACAQKTERERDSSAAT